MTKIERKADRSNRSSINVNKRIERSNGQNQQNKHKAERLCNRTQQHGKRKSNKLKEITEMTVIQRNYA